MCPGLGCATRCRKGRYRLAGACGSVMGGASCFVGPVVAHEVICHSSAVLRCIVAGRSASCEEHHAGVQLVSKPFRAPATILFPPCARFILGRKPVSLLWCFMGADLTDPVGSTRLREGNSAKYRCMDSCSLSESRSAQAGNHMRP